MIGEQFHQEQHRARVANQPKRPGCRTAYGSILAFQRINQEWNGDTP
jgi:hypothetical protein